MLSPLTRRQKSAFSAVPTYPSKYCCDNTGSFVEVTSGKGTFLNLGIKILGSSGIARAAVVGGNRSPTLISNTVAILNKRSSSGSLVPLSYPEIVLCLVPILLPSSLCVSPCNFRYSRILVATKSLVSIFAFSLFSSTRPCDSLSRLSLMSAMAVL